MGFLWLNRLILNANNTKFIRFKPHVSKECVKMGVHIEGNLIILWDNHIMKLKEKLSLGVGILYKFRN